MRRLVLWLVAGCNSILGIEELADPEVCLGDNAFPVCAEPIATSLRITGPALDTDTDPRCETRTQVTGPDFCLISARSIAVVGEIAVVGTRPLTLFASGDIVLATGAQLDASSRRGVQLGANASTPFCDTGGAPPVVSNSAAGGGAGGSFGGQGGNGGQGANQATGGKAGDPVMPSALRGGCRGRDGGVFMAGNPPGEGGDSGGAIYLVAGLIRIENAASIVASGAGGGGGPPMLRGGGGGGGSGGMIVLHAPTVDVAGALVAHGGGGGEGGTATPGGVAGENGPEEFGRMAAGGDGGTGGGNGGHGSGHMAAAQNGQDGGTNSGGGGGGGGAGVIYVRGTLTGGASISPTPL